MYKGELRLGSLALTELKLRVTSQGLVLEAQGLLKAGDGVGPHLEIAFRKSTSWTEPVVSAAEELVRQAETAIGEALGDGDIQSLEVPEANEDIAGSMEKSHKIPEQF